MGRPKHTRAMAGGALEKGGKGGVFVGAKVLHYFVPPLFTSKLSCGALLLYYSMKNRGGGGDTFFIIPIYIHPLEPHLSAFNIFLASTSTAPHVLYGSDVCVLQPISLLFPLNDSSSPPQMSEHRGALKLSYPMQHGVVQNWCVLICALQCCYLHPS